MGEGVARAAEVRMRVDVAITEVVAVLVNVLMIVSVDVRVDVVVDVEFAVMVCIVVTTFVEVRSCEVGTVITFVACTLVVRVLVRRTVGLTRLVAVLVEYVVEGRSVVYCTTALIDRQAVEYADELRQAEAYVGITLAVRVEGWH